ncbi:hypothetical protein ACHAWF_011983 [Thalassiosira exigua]
MAPPPSAKPHALTPVRSPAPPPRRWRERYGERAGAGEEAGTETGRSACAASSSEKETPTIVMTERSPMPTGTSGRGGSSGGTKSSAGGGRGAGRGANGGIGIGGVGVGGGGATPVPTMTRARRIVAAPSEKLFDDDEDEDDKSSEVSRTTSPGSRAEQTLAGGGGRDSNDDCDSDDGAPTAARTQTQIERSQGDDAAFEVLSERSSSSSPSSSQSRSNDDDDSDESRRLRVTSMIQNVLDGGVASICRLRGLFPSHFFRKMDVEGTTVTQFRTEEIERIAKGAGCAEGGVEEDEGDEGSEGGEEASMVRSVNPRTQKSLSPLTEHSQKRRRFSPEEEDDQRVECSVDEKRMAREAHVLIRWMQNEGVGAALREGNLARIVFGIRAPSKEGGEGELIESYTFSVSCAAPDNPGAVDEARMLGEITTVFQNLNGYKAGRASFSQRSVVPSRTQGTHGGGTQTQTTQASFGFSQASSRYLSQYDTQAFSEEEEEDSSKGGGHFSLSQKHLRPRTQPQTQPGTQTQTQAASQKSLLASMSQSIHRSVKGRNGATIPKDRYLTLRVDFANPTERDELPPALRRAEEADGASREGPTKRAKGGATKGHTTKTPRGAPSTGGAMRVTPLGRIVEGGYSGLCVDVAARSRVARGRGAGDEGDGGRDEDDGEGASVVDFSQFSWRSERSSRPPDGGRGEESKELEDSHEKANAKGRGRRAESIGDREEEVQEEDKGPRRGESPEKANADVSESPVGENLCEEADFENTGAGDWEMPGEKLLREKTEEKENLGVEVGGKAFGIPYGLKGPEPKFIECDILDHRAVTSCLDGKEREEFKCSFRSRELNAAGKKKQWILKAKVISYDGMARKVEEALARRKSATFEETASRVKVDTGVVRSFASKRKVTLEAKDKGRRKRAKGNLRTSHLRSLGLL